MKCECKYYHYVDGKLLCSECGKPSPKFDYKTEDEAPAEVKMEEKVEDKALHIPVENKRVKHPAKKRKK